jgi:T5SS/PEP-CTERM-associated repeat protein
MIVVLTGATAFAQTFDWIDTAGGLFNDAANWSPAGGPPSDETELALFDLNNTYTVFFESSVTNDHVSVDNGNVTFALGGETYSLQDNGLGARALQIANVAGQTGRLTLSNGTLSILVGDLDVASSSAGIGFLTIGDDAILNGRQASVGVNGVGTMTINNGGRYISTDAFSVGGGGFLSPSPGNGTLAVTGSGSSLSSGALIVADSGPGTATISSGGAASTQAVTLAAVAGFNGALTVTGSGSSLTTNGQSVTVGESGTGDFTVSSGGSVAAGQTTLGNLAGSSGSLSVTSPSSSFASSSGTFTVGAAGTGSMEITGGTTTSLISRIASGVGSIGHAAVSGSGSTWNATSLAIGGQIGVNGGVGTLTIESGGLVNVAGATELRSSAGSALTIDGGTLVSGGNFTRLGTFNLRDGTLHVKGIYDHGAAPAALVIDGATSGDSATLRLSGNAAVQDVTTITVGNKNQGALVLDSGRVLNVGANSISIGTDGLASGTITLNGNNTSLTTTGTLSVGGSGATPGGAGIINIGAGATVDAGLINLFALGGINVNGGTLRVGNFVPQGGSVDFNAGEITLTTAVIASETQLDALLGPTHVLGAGRRLSGTTSLSFNAPLSVSGGDVFAATSITNLSTLQIDAGSLVATTTLTNNAGRLLAISGAATVTATSGITNSGTIELDNNLIATSGGTLTNSGTIRGSGFIGNNLTNNAAGQVQATTGQRLEFQGATNTNSGSISLVGGEVVFTGSLTNSASTGLISNGGAILRVNGGISNNGALAVPFGVGHVFGDINNSGSVVVSGGAMAVFYDDITQNGTLIVRKVGSTTSAAVILGAFTGAGGSSGGGDIFFEGDLRPGNSPATVNFGNNIAFGSAATIEIELGGTTPGSQYDQILVAGQLALDGTLAVTPINGFSPAAGNSFNILDWGGLSGTFSSLILPTLAGLAWDTSQLYTDGVLTLVTANLPGDYNQDGRVNAADYTVWRNNLGSLASLPNDDTAGVGPDDYARWKNHFGEIAGSAAGASGNSAVPEPETLVLAILATFGVSLRRRRTAAKVAEPVPA